MSESMSPAGYIGHHLLNLQLNLKTMKVGPSTGFWTLNLDTLFVSIFLGVLFLGVLYWAACRRHAGVPSASQNFAELCVEKVDDVVRESYHGDSPLIAPLAMTVFIWVFLMNLMDLIPVDLLPRLFALMGAQHFRAVPTADPMATFAMSIPVFFLILFYNIKMKGLGGFIVEVFTRPFHMNRKDVLGYFFNLLLMPVNVFFRVIEEVVKPISLSLRLLIHRV